ncbi:hypothetical protein EV363DRAFT_1536446 [Boletus edulis]|nr:hypothetical protein EV363DRAFT_1536446 [Boletus edulis]
MTPTPELLTPEQFKAFLKHLDALLQNLPDAVPVGVPTASKYDYFLSFTLDADLEERTGCEIGAFNEQLKGIFGWKARTTGDGILPIDERGEPICAVVSVLRRFHEKYPNDAIVKKWAVDIALGAEKLYRQHGIESHMCPRKDTSTIQPEVSESSTEDELDAYVNPDEPEADSDLTVDQVGSAVHRVGDRVVYTDDDIDLDSPYLLDILTTVPVSGTMQPNATSTRVEKPPSVDGGVPDWDW